MLQGWGYYPTNLAAYLFKNHTQMKTTKKLLNVLLVFLLISCGTDDDEITAEFTLTSAAVKSGVLLDAFKCEAKVNGAENSIPLTWSNVPEGTGSLAVVMHHFPNPDDHTKANCYLLLWGIDPSVTEIPYGMADNGDWYMGPNKDGTAISYTSPCSHSTGTHEYTITLYALSATPASLPQNSSLSVTYEKMIEAIGTVTVVDKAILTFKVITP
jgi:phosphatidylethanolamine-binding protein (PEBP) family uncharacterized protein